MYSYFGQLAGFAAPHWFGIEPISSGVFGVKAGFVATIVVSWLDRAPDGYTMALVNCIRHP